MARETFEAKRIGAAFFWILKGFGGKYSEQLEPEHDSRNIWTGYIITLVLFIAFIYLCVVEK
ncbi:hypothetical protein QEG73_10060 [Chitinophagaceae bacterium 26-R-25]|nr:hypothetical protein [Chitinophagaceae bacterium 26-R-25]